MQHRVTIKSLDQTTNPSEYCFPRNHTPSLTPPQPPVAAKQFKL